MGGFFGITSHRDCVEDVFFGVDYHSHLGAHRAGMCAVSEEAGFQREIHNIENSPFRTKFENTTSVMSGSSCIGCISDTDPQPILVLSKLGVYAISTIGTINNASELTKEFISLDGGHFEAMSGGKVNQTELVATLINRKNSFEEGISFAQQKISGSASILILASDGSLIAARDRLGRLPVIIGKNESGYCVSFESFAFQKLGYTTHSELGPGEIVRIGPDNISVLKAAGEEMRICAFLWTYYGYPTSAYEGINVECMRNRNGESMAQADAEYLADKHIDYVGGVPDSGIGYAIGYSNESKIPYARPFIKYTPTWPRSFMPKFQSERNKVARMKLIPVHDLIENKNLLFVDDSIVRGTQLRETVDFLYENGAKEVHIRSSCPPIMYGCKYLNFSRNTSDLDMITRRTIKKLEGEEGYQHLEEYADRNTERGKAMRREICKEMHFSSLDFQSKENLIKSIGLPECKVCTYCWDGKE